MRPDALALALLSLLSLAALLLTGCETATYQSANTAAQGGVTARQFDIVHGAPAPAPAPSTTLLVPIARARAAPTETARYPDAAPNPVRATNDEPVSTFSADVDTASYAVARRFLREGRLPPAAAVRVEEMMNYFPYGLSGPADHAHPFQTSATILPTPWNSETKLLHIGIKGFDIPRSQRPRANIVLLIDVSGSMAPPDRLPLLKEAFHIFVQQMRDTDRVAIVTYAGRAQTALEPTMGRDRGRILDVLDSLQANGSTAGGEGLQRSYAMAERNFESDAVNRIILATDGDFNVGITDPKRLEDYIAEKRKTGVYLTVLGVGLDNLNDALMQRLSHAGNGHAAYIDSVLEARKVLAEQLSSTLFPIANDVKIQVEFNPASIAEYRLIGYETRLLRREDFRNDNVDAGDIGAGHAVTALYEIVPAGSRARLIEPLKYRPEPPASGGLADEYATVRIRYKLPGESSSRLIETAVTNSAEHSTLNAAPPDQRFAAAVAAFAQLLRHEPYLKDFRLADAAALANGARGDDPSGYRAEFVQLVRLAETLEGNTKP